MNIPVLLTKVIPPHRREDILTRRRLINQLDKLLDNKLIIITAPAGYGKTSLLVDFARSSELPICWYSLDAADQDLHRFLTHFLASIEQRFSGFGELSKEALRVFNNGDITMEHFVVAIVNEIFNSMQEHFVIVLDDYHLVNQSETINYFINRFVQDVDHNCHLVILSRSFISLPDLPLLVARTEAGGVGFVELAFRADEIKTLMWQNFQYEISLATAEELEQKTDGWITGLLLSAHTMLDGMADRLSLMRASGAGLFDFLIHQVLDQQQTDLRDFLLRTSFFEEFDAELCGMLFGPHPQDQTWHKTMNKALKNNLFALPIGEKSDWLKYHHLFQKFLQNQFEQEQPDELERVLKSLVEIYSDRQEWERAYAFCLRLGDIEWTVNFLKQAGEPMVRSGRTALLGSWLDELPVTVMDEHPALLARRGVILATQGDAKAGVPLLDRAVLCFRSSDNSKRLAGTLVWRALAFHILSDLDRSIADANEALALTEDRDNESSLKRFRAEAYRILGQNYRMLGKMDESIENLSRALNIYLDQEDDQGANLIRLNLGAIYLDAGDFSEALSHYSPAREYYQKQGNSTYLAATLNDMGFVQHLRAEFQEAFVTYEQALANAGVGGNARIQMLILIGIGDLFADLDAPESADEAYSRARQLLEKVTDHFLSVYLILAEAIVARIKGDLQRAQMLVDSANQIALKKPSNYTRGLILLELGRQSSALDNHKRASAEFAGAVHLFEEGGQTIQAGRANLALANTYYEMGELEAATARLNKAFELVASQDGQNFLLPTARQAKSFLASMSSSPQVGLSALYLYERVLRFETALPELRHSLRFQKMTIPFTPPRLRIQALGEIRVTLNDKLVSGSDWQTQDTRDLLFLLLLEPKGWRREAIGELLWPGSTSTKLRSHIKNATYRLRRALQQNVVIFGGGLYYFNRELDYEYDVERLQELSSQAKTITNREDLQILYEEIVQLYSGEYLPEVSGVWAHSERERLLQIFISAGLKLSKLYMEASQYDLALEISCRLIDEDSCLEQAYWIAMKAHAAIGNVSAVVRQYESLKTTLRVELDVSPSSQTETLYSSLIH
ncbi:tetratricopeptide repeat protein [Chloroflexota bacterium]